MTQTYNAFRAARLMLMLLGLAVAATPSAAQNDEQPAAPRGFAGLGGQADGFAEVRPGRVFRFPDDYGQHPNYRIEWWYITANLYDDAGETYGIQWTLFRQALEPGDDHANVTETRDVGVQVRSPWRDRQVWMAHIAATSATKHYFEERLARGGIGQAGVSSAPFAAWLDEWRFAGLNKALSQFSLAANGASFAYELALEAQGPVVLQGDGGYHVKSSRGPGVPQASYYFSQPHFRVSGVLTLDGEAKRVRGRGWLDREWSSQPLAPEQTGWDWFSLHFQGGEKMMVYHLRRSDGAPPDLAGVWVDAEGQATHLSSTELRLTPLEPVGKDEAPRRWRIEAPTQSFAVSVEPLNAAAWQDGIIPYWEGPIVFSGTHQGVGYLEMTGYQK